jgi:hypothetical protein
MYLRFQPNIICSRHRFHTFRFTHTAAGTFPEHRFYCAICEVDGEACCFGENEICYPELVDDGIDKQDDHLDWLHDIVAEIGLPLETCEAKAA